MEEGYERGVNWEALMVIALLLIFWASVIYMGLYLWWDNTYRSI